MAKEEKFTKWLHTYTKYRKSKQALKAVTKERRGREMGRKGKTPGRNEENGKGGKVHKMATHTHRHTKYRKSKQILKAVTKEKRGREMGRK